MDGKIVVIGSEALVDYTDIGRVPKDIDYVMTWATFQSWLLWLKTQYKISAVYPISEGKKQVVKTDTGIFEVEIAWENSTALELMKIAALDRRPSCALGKFELIFAPLDLLYELKMSHRFLKNSPHFEKTRIDILKMRELGAKIVHQKFYIRRQAETYTYSHPALNVSKNEFFKDETFYKYDHDDIHEAIKLGPIPAYKYILEDGAQVKCSKAKWDELPLMQKYFCAIEECITLTLERGLIPNDFKTDPYKTYKLALMKVCTSITSGWFREWCWENYDAILLSYQPNFVKRFQTALTEGKIRDFKSEIY